MGSWRDRLRCWYAKRQAFRSYPPYRFQRDPGGYLIYKNDLDLGLRRFLNGVQTALEWIIKKKEERNLNNRRILESIGVNPETDITSLDAFYKREFRKKKYIYFFTDKPSRDLPEPPRFLLEYIPKVPTAAKQSLVKSALIRRLQERKAFV